MQPAQTVVINKDIIGMSPEDLNIPATYGVLIKSVVRMRMEMPHSHTLKIKKGDILNVVGSSQNIEKLGKKLGHVEKEIAETDMVTFCFGICFGVLIGWLAINVGQLSIGPRVFRGYAFSWVSHWLLAERFPNFWPTSRCSPLDPNGIGIAAFHGWSWSQGRRRYHRDLHGSWPPFDHCRGYGNDDTYFGWLFFWQKNTQNSPGFAVWRHLWINDQWGFAQCRHQRGRQRNAISWLYRGIRLCQCFAYYCRKRDLIFLSTPCPANNSIQQSIGTTTSTPALLATCFHAALMRYHSGGIDIVSGSLHFQHIQLFEFTDNDP